MTVSDFRANSGPLRPERPRVLGGNPSLIAGRPWTHRLFWLVILVAAGVDIVTFYQVLILVLNVIDPLVWVAVTGFTVVALVLAHYAGTQAKQAISPRNVRGAAIGALVCLGVWLSLGGMAFVVRYTITPASAANVTVDGVAQSGFGQSADLSSQHLSAWLFLALYLGTGMVSALDGFLRHDPAIKEYARALKQRTKVARRHAITVARLASATQTLDAVSEARDRRQEAWENIEQQCIDGAERLRQEARLQLRRFRPPDANDRWPDGGGPDDPAPADVDVETTPPFVQPPGAPRSRPAETDSFTATEGPSS